MAATSKRGTLWSKLDEKKLVTMFRNGDSIAQIVNELKRSESAIYTRLKAWGYVYWDKEQKTYVKVIPSRVKNDDFETTLEETKSVLDELGMKRLINDQSLRQIEKLIEQAGLKVAILKVMQRPGTDRVKKIGSQKNRYDFLCLGYREALEKYKKELEKSCAIRNHIYLEEGVVRKEGYLVADSAQSLLLEFLNEIDTIESAANDIHKTSAVMKHHSYLHYAYQFLHSYKAPTRLKDIPEPIRKELLDISEKYEVCFDRFTILSLNAYEEKRKRLCPDLSASELKTRIAELTKIVSTEERTAELQNKAIKRAVASYEKMLAQQFGGPGKPVIRTDTDLYCLIYYIIQHHSDKQTRPDVASIALKAMVPVSQVNEELNKSHRLPVYYSTIPPMGWCTILPEYLEREKPKGKVWYDGSAERTALTEEQLLANKYNGACKLVKSGRQLVRETPGTRHENDSRELLLESMDELQEYFEAYATYAACGHYLGKVNIVQTNDEETWGFLEQKTTVVPFCARFVREAGTRICYHFYTFTKRTSKDGFDFDEAIDERLSQLSALYPNYQF